MTRSGPQYYPGAITSGASWYEDNYGGSAMEVNVLAVHTTEGTSLPGYGGGASAPNITFLPNIKSKRLQGYQHFRIDTSSRALVNLRGGVETNTLNVVQAEFVGTCDPATSKRWGGKNTSHIFWPDAPDWAYEEMAEFFAWLHEEHGVPLTGPSKWPAYPSSYGNGQGQRMSFSEWNSFKGICGHMHVPENSHGDPGSIPFGEIIDLAKSLVGDKDDDKPTTPSKPKPTVPAFPGRKWFALGQSNKYVTQLGTQLKKKGFGKHYSVGPGPRWSEADRRNVRDFQRSDKRLAGDADGYPGPLTWKLLFS